VVEERTPKESKSVPSAREEARNSLKRRPELREKGRFHREGPKGVSPGPPNAGESELLDAILGKKRTLASTVPAPRDYLTDAVFWGKVRAERVKSAGSRQKGGDELEKMGRKLALERMGKADLAPG
jgi:tRNA U34 5-carboxymethylaminomethyl modifying GTPase MnmE/TrmE